MIKIYKNDIINNLSWNLCQTRYNGINIKFSKTYNGHWLMWEFRNVRIIFG